MPAPAEKKQNDYEERRQKLEQARMLHKSISKKMSIAGITRQEIKEDVCKARAYVRKTSYIGRN